MRRRPSRGRPSFDQQRRDLANFAVTRAAGMFPKELRPLINPLPRVAVQGRTGWSDWAGYDPADQTLVFNAMLWMRPALHLKTVGGLLVLVDCACHELVHHALQGRDGDSDRTHGRRFCQLANEVGARTKLGPVHPSSDVFIGGGAWPLNIRDPGQYGTSAVAVAAEFAAISRSGARTVAPTGRTGRAGGVESSSLARLTFTAEPVRATRSDEHQLEDAFAKLYRGVAKKVEGRLRASAVPLTIRHESAVVASASEEPQIYIADPWAVFGTTDEWVAAIEASDMASALEGLFLDTAHRTALGYAFDVAPAPILQLVQEHLAAIESWGSDLSAHVARSVSEGVDKGEGIDAIAARLVDPAHGIFGSERATLIARTETISGVNGASWVTNSQLGQAGVLGLAPQKQWLATNDLRTRETHAEADGQVVGLDADFLVGGYHARYPGDGRLPPAERISCRCTHLTLPDDENAAVPAEASVST